MYFLKYIISDNVGIQDSISFYMGSFIGPSLVRAEYLLDSRRRKCQESMYHIINYHAQTC